MWNKWNNGTFRNEWNEVELLEQTEQNVSFKTKMEFVERYGTDGTDGTKWKNGIFGTNGTRK